MELYNIAWDTIDFLDFVLTLPDGIFVSNLYPVGRCGGNPTCIISAPYERLKQFATEDLMIPEDDFNIEVFRDIKHVKDRINHSLSKRAIEQNLSILKAIEEKIVNQGY